MGQSDPFLAQFTAFSIVVVMMSPDPSFECRPI